MSATKKQAKEMDGYIERLSLEEAASYCHCSIRHLQEEVNRKNLRAYKPGKFVLFEIDELNKWIKKKALS